MFAVRIRNVYVLYELFIRHVHVGWGIQCPFGRIGALFFSGRLACCGVCNDIARKGRKGESI